jgi:hypothetical protein
MGGARVRDMTNKELRAEIECIVAMIQKGPVGNTLASRARIVAVMRETARRMKPAPLPTKD